MPDLGTNKVTWTDVHDGNTKIKNFTYFDNGRAAL
jgi:hypothetical protein